MAMNRTARWAAVGAKFGSTPFLAAARQLSKRGIFGMHLGELVGSAAFVGLSAGGAVAGATLGIAASGVVALRDAALRDLEPLYARVMAGRDADRKARAEAAAADAEGRWADARRADGQMRGLRAPDLQRASGARAAVERAALSALIASEALSRVMSGQGLANVAAQTKAKLIALTKGNPAENARSDYREASDLCRQARAWQADAAKPSVASASGNPPTALRLDEAHDWWSGQGYAAVRHDDHVAVEIAEGARIIDRGDQLIADGPPSEVLIRAMLQRAADAEWTEVEIMGTWPQEAVDSVARQAARMGIAVDFRDGLAPSPSVAADLRREAEAKLSAKQDAEAGVSLKAYYGGADIADARLRAYADAHPEAAKRLETMTAGELQIAARQARDEGAELIAADPQAGRSRHDAADTPQDERKYG